MEAVRTDLLERLARSAACDNDAPAHGPGELHRQTEETAQADRAFAAALEAVRREIEATNTTLLNSLNELDNVNGASLSAYEEQGFINGFRMGVMLMLEVLE